MPSKAKQRLYFNLAKTALFPMGHEEAASLYANTGDEIPDSAADAFGLVDGDLPDFPATEGDEAEAAAAEAEAEAADKAEEDRKAAEAEAAAAEAEAEAAAKAEEDRKAAEAEAAAKEAAKSADKSKAAPANKAVK